MLRRSLLAATAALLVTGAASAAPVVNDPNFNLTLTSALSSYYGMAAWVVAGNGSYVGSSPLGSILEWNNGTPGNGQATVGFIANNGYISQAISGFTVGDAYTISVLANGRTGVGGATLQISTSASATPVFSAAEAPVDPVNVAATPFRSVTTSSFVANASTMTVTLANAGAADSTVLLSGFSLTDLGATPVSEPTSAMLLGAGLLCWGLVRRRS